MIDWNIFFGFLGFVATIMMTGATLILVVLISCLISREVSRFLTGTDFYDPVGFFIGIFSGTLLWAAILVSWK